MYTTQQLVDIDRQVKVALTALTHRQPERARALLSNLEIDLSRMIDRAEAGETSGRQLFSRSTAHAFAGHDLVPA